MNQSLIELIKGRRTVHKYKDEQIDQEVVNKAIEMAIFAPSHKLTFPTRFYQIPKDQRKKLAEISFKVRANLGRVLSEEDKKNIEKKFTIPSHLLIVSYVHHEDPVLDRENYATLSCAIQNFSLYLWDLGLGTKWSSGPLIRHKDLYDLLKIDKNLESIEAMLWAGVPDITPNSPQRPSVEEIFTVFKG